MLSEPIYENGLYFIIKDKNRYTVCKNKNTYSETVASFEFDEDGLSFAINYVNYFANRQSNIKIKSETIMVDVIKDRRGGARIGSGPKPYFGDPMSNSEKKINHRKLKKLRKEL